jgi:hypothetical protein
MNSQQSYTPRDKVTGERYQMRLSMEDIHKVMSHGRRTGFKGQITDLNTGKVWRIYGAACGLPGCICDAVAVEVKK